MLAGRHTICINKNIHPCTPCAEESLAQLRSSDNLGLYASSDLLFRDAVFGRDSAEAADDLLELDHLIQVDESGSHHDTLPDLVGEIILALASLQGTVTSEHNEEEPGRIHHEYRSLYVGQRKISESSQEIMQYLMNKWGGSNNRMLYYGSVDATPLYVRLVLNYCQKYGNEVLNWPFTNKDGQGATIHESVVAAIEWIYGRIMASDVRLLEFCTTNPQGIKNQVWKDSSTSFIHDDGTIINHQRPVAAIEAQGLAYDALISGTVRLKVEAKVKRRWRQAALALRDSTFGRLWLEEAGCFAMGLDRDHDGSPRIIRTISSNQAMLLDSLMFDGLSRTLRRKYVSGIVKTLYHPDFMTDVGLRCRSLAHQNLVIYQDYHGSWASWIKDTYDAARGLRRQGFGRLADQLEIRILNGVRLGGKFMEFFYVDPEGVVNYRPVKADATPSEKISKIILGTNVPEDNQAWTVSAVLAARQRQCSETVPQQTGNRWERNLEEKLMEIIPQHSLANNEMEPPAQSRFAINVPAGLVAEFAFESMYR